MLDEAVGGVKFGRKCPIDRGSDDAIDREMMSGSSIDNGRNGGTVRTVMERAWTGRRLIRLYCTVLYLLYQSIKGDG
jgi:hypothetical protein